MNDEYEKKINKLYKGLTYFDNYGGTVISFIIITLILIIIVSYCFIQINIQNIKNNWPNERCKPYIIPFAGIINPPPGVSAKDYTNQNFTYCTQNITSGIAGDALSPLTFIVKIITNIYDAIENAINDIRAMMNNIRNKFMHVGEEIMGKIMNVMIPLQQIIIALRDFIAKVEGTLTAGLYTLFGAYMTLQTLLGAIAQFILIILIILAVMIMGFWIFPFTWGFAISSTVIFLAISIPLAVILVFMADVLHVTPTLAMPSVPSCFDGNTMIKMNNETFKSIKDIKPGDILFKDNKVNAIFKLNAKNKTMYNLNNVIVSETHKVKYYNKWIYIYQHPKAKIIENYNESFIYCLNTSSKIIIINDNIFCDWDELYDNNILGLNSEMIHLNRMNNCIHTILDGGFSFDTQIELQNGTIKNIIDINIGDILYDNCIVYGIVKIDGKDLSEQYNYNLGENYIEGGPNLVFMSSKNDSNINLDDIKIKKLDNKYDYLYHLLTNKNYFYVKNIKFYDYNGCVDLFLDNK